MIYVIGIGPGDPSYGLLGQEAYFEKADRILSAIWKFCHRLIGIRA